MEVLSPNSMNLLQVKSKYQAEFRRFPVDIEHDTFEDFFHKVEAVHQLVNHEFVITYTDPVHGDLLPINNGENFTKAKTSCLTTLMRVYIHRKDNLNLMNGFGQSTVRRGRGKKTVPKISFPEDFRPVSAIIDVDILPDTLRRVRLHNHGINKPLGFFIRDGVSLRMSDNGLEKVPGIFISRLVQGGLAEMTGLLAVNDEVIEVNGIEVGGKSLDQVTDMMVANSSNLIITVKPASMRNSVGAARSRSHDQFPVQSMARQQAYDSDDDDDGDVVNVLPSKSQLSSRSSGPDTIHYNASPKGSPKSSITETTSKSQQMQSFNPSTPPHSREQSGRKAKNARDSLKGKRSNDTISV